jgi:transcriptional regulator with XRE-family HTH domain
VTTIVLPLDYHTDLIASIAQVLVESRHAAGLTQRQLAAAAGVGHGMISAYEAGRRHPTIVTLARLLEAARADGQLVVVAQQRPTLPNGLLKLAHLDHRSSR